MDFDSTKDYYKILGVEKNATTEKIKSAYYKLAKEYHPDKNQGKTVEKFKEINNAYETLSEPTKRSQYDSMRSYSSFGGFQGFSSNNYSSNNQYRKNTYQQNTNQQQQGTNTNNDFFKDFDDFFNRMKNEFKKSRNNEKTANTGESTSKKDNFKDYYGNEKKKVFYKGYFEKNKKYYKNSNYNKDFNKVAGDEKTFNFNSSNINLFIIFGGLFFLFIFFRSNSQRQQQLQYPPGGPQNDQNQNSKTLFSNSRPNYSNNDEYTSGSNRFR